jgi:hypothetical protein
LTPKSVSLGTPIGDLHEIVVEVPRGLLHQRQSDPIGPGFTDKAIALDIARDVVLKTVTHFPTIGNARPAFTMKIDRSGTRIDIAL